MPLRLFQGLSLACLFVVTDTWVNQLAPAHARGRVLGFYSMLTSAGFAIGPALLLIVGTQGWAPFLAGAACGLLSLLPLIASRAEFPSRDGTPGQSILAFLPVTRVPRRRHWQIRLPCRCCRFSRCAPGWMSPAVM